MVFFVVIILETSFLLKDHEPGKDDLRKTINMMLNVNTFCLCDIANLLSSACM